MPNAIEMLKEDHRKVQQLFEQFEQSDEDEAKEEICEKTVRELETHAALEEEIFYPAAEPHVDEEELVDEAREEHHVAKLLMGELKKMGAGDERFAAKYKVLAESVKHHIEEEESELFPMIQDEIDADSLGEKMQARKQELERRMTNGSAAKRGKSKTASARSRSRKSAKGRTQGKKGRGRAAAGRR